MNGLSRDRLATNFLPMVFVTLSGVRSTPATSACPNGRCVDLDTERNHAKDRSDIDEFSKRRVCTQRKSIPFVEGLQHNCLLAGIPTGEDNHHLQSRNWEQMRQPVRTLQQKYGRTLGSTHLLFAKGLRHRAGYNAKGKSVSRHHVGLGNARIDRQARNTAQDAAASCCIQTECFSHLTLVKTTPDCTSTQSTRTSTGNASKTWLVEAARGEIDNCTSTALQCVNLPRLGAESPHYTSYCATSTGVGIPPRGYDSNPTSFTIACASDTHDTPSSRMVSGDGYGGQ